MVFFQHQNQSARVGPDAGRFREPRVADKEGKLTPKQTEQILHALHLGKTEAANYLYLSKHIEGAYHHYETVVEEIDKALHLLSLNLETSPTPRGCVCPPASELTCQNITCPRKGYPQPSADPNTGAIYEYSE